MPPVKANGIQGEAVSIGWRQVRRIAAHLREDFRGSPPEQTKWDDPEFWNIEASREARCQFLAIGNAINFRFWSVREGRVAPATGVLEGTDYRGSIYLWRRLRLALARGEFSLEADFLGSLTEKQFEQAFKDDHGNLPLESGLADRLANLVDLGMRLTERWNGQFANLIDASEGSLQRFAELSATFRAYDDPVRKLTMVNAIMLTGSELVIFNRDPQPGIDYHLVKQAVRQGLVDPPPLTRSKLETGELLTSEESLVLRSATLEALLSVADHADLSTAVIDNLYWLNRRVCDENTPACKQDGDPRCPFESVCDQRVEFGLPLEITRYY